MRSTFFELIMVSAKMTRMDMPESEMITGAQTERGEGGRFPLSFLES